MQAKKRFGQNFLHDEMVIQKIINSLKISADDFFLEIGPGRGALTGQLIGKVSCLQVIEIDRDLVLQLQCMFKQHLGVDFFVHEQDVLAFDFSKNLSIAGGDQKIRLLGNLPYNISTPLLFLLFSHLEKFQDLQVMLQKEVAYRLCAAPGDAAYGRLSVMAQYYCHINVLFEVPPGAFSPPPKVMSCFIQLQPHAEAPYEVDDWPWFEAVVREAFSHRRKTLGNALKRYLPGAELKQALIQAGIDLTLRPGCVDGASYARIARVLATQKHF